MLLEPLFIMVCNTIGSETPGHAQASCQNVLNAGSEQTKTSQMMSELESYSQHFVYKNVNGEVIKGAIAAGFLIDSYNQRIVRANIPIKPFEIDLNLGIINKTLGAKYRYDF